MMEVLIIERDPDVVETLSLALTIRWPQALVAATQLGAEGVRLAGREELNLVILELDLPDLNGFEVLKWIRVFSSVPIVIHTARGDEADVVKGLELGADDYIVKPYGHLAFLSRINASLRRRAMTDENPRLSFGQLCLDTSTNRFSCGQTEVGLTATETRIVACLMRGRGRVATHSMLSKELWGEYSPGSVESLRVHVRRLGEKIEEEERTPVIRRSPSQGLAQATSRREP